MATGRVPTTANSPLTAKGDLFTYSTAPARLAVGNSGEQLVADSAATTGLRYQSNFAAGKNKIINGDFGVWQRGTSFTNPSPGAYLADRFGCGFDGSGATRIFSQQTFTPGTAPVSGYEGQYYLRLNQTVAGTGGSYNLITQPIEDVRTFAGQTVTISFWAKAAAGFSFGQVDLFQYFGSGGSGAVTTAGTSSDAAVTTSWKRFVYNVTVPSVSGKTIGTGSYIQLRTWLPTNTTFTFDIWGVQIEAGSVATAFQTATGTLQGELSACQRYYFRNSADATDSYYSFGSASSTTQANLLVSLPQTMRVAPTSFDYSNARLTDGAGNNFTISSLVLNWNSKATPNLFAGGATGMTQFRPMYLTAAGTTSSYIAFNAEL
jgi:hypothetical protein